MNRAKLFEQINKKQSFLCVGLDTDLTKIPSDETLRKITGEDITTDCDRIFAFNKLVIDNTHELCVAYKPNLAFYEAAWIEGMQALERTIKYIKHVDPEILIIADAKRGDIGNTAKKYAEAYFGNLDVDAITLSPYMGEDSVEPYIINYPNKWVILLGLTSNKGSKDVQQMRTQGPVLNSSMVFERVIRKASTWGTPENTMFVIGATKATYLAELRKIIPEHFLLVPGIGAQGGSLDLVAKHGMNAHCGLLVNSSRGIIYHWQSEMGCADAIKQNALDIQKEMKSLLTQYLSA